MSNAGYIAALANVFRANADAHMAAGAKAYMRNQFEYFGIATPQRRAITRKFIEQHGLPQQKNVSPLVKQLWKLPQREFQYFAMELLENKKILNTNIGLLEYMVVNRSWWDTVDFISPKLIGPYFKQHPQLIRPKTKQWMKSENMWLMRSALLFQMKYKSATDEKLLYSLIRQSAHHENFFIRKAIGWALREHSKTFPASVKKFVKINPQLSSLSKKEALRRIMK